MWVKWNVWGEPFVGRESTRFSHVNIQRERGIEFLSRLIRGAAELGSYAVAGIIYSAWPHPYERDMIDKQIKYERTMRSIESMRGVMPLAESCGVSLYAEVINRFEHYMLNTAAEGVDYCKQVGSERLKLLLDVFHMNIEEDSFEQAIQAAGRYIGHFHVSEPNRRLPTPGSRVNWGSMGRALRETGYEGSVTMEPILLFFGTDLLQFPAVAGLYSGYFDGRTQSDVEGKP